MTGAERRYSQERRLRFWYFNFSSRLRKNKQVSFFHLGGATNTPGLTERGILVKNKVSWCERARKVREKLRVDLHGAINKNTAGFPSHATERRQERERLSQIWRGEKSFKALKLGLSLKKFQQRGLCPDLIPGVKREQETLDSVFDSRRKEMKTPFTTLHTKGETK